MEKENFIFNVTNRIYAMEDYTMREVIFLLECLTHVKLFVVVGFGMPVQVTNKAIKHMINQQISITGGFDHMVNCEYFPMRNEVMFTIREI